MIAIYNRLKDYRDLLLVFIWREFTIRYKQSFIGILWAVLQPLSMMLLFTFVFTYIKPVKFSNYPYVLFLYSALLPWSFFSSSVNYAVPSLTNHYNLITKIYFPREILPLSGVVVAVIDFFLASLVYIVLLIVFKAEITWSVRLLVSFFLLLVIFAASVSLIPSALNFYYLGVKLATWFLIQLWFFATPVFHSIDKVSVKLKLILFLNPFMFIVENIPRQRDGRRRKNILRWHYLGYQNCLDRRKRRVELFLFQNLKS